MKETITVEKEVYECVLRNSLKIVDLEAENRRLKKVERKKGKLVNENYKLKELLKECNKTFFEIRLALSSGKINSVFDLSYQRENDINEVLK